MPVVGTMIGTGNTNISYGIGTGTGACGTSKLFTLFVELVPELELSGGDLAVYVGGYGTGNVSFRIGSASASFGTITACLGTGNANASCGTGTLKLALMELTYY